MSKKVLVLTGTTDILKEIHYKNDNNMEEVFDMTLPSKQNYAKKHGYDFMALRSFGVDFRNVFTDKDIGQLRFIRTMEMLTFYDAVFWIDADSLITNFNYKLENFVDDTITFAASYDWMHTRTFSSGNFIVQKNNNTQLLYNEFYAIGKNFNSEQETLNYIFNMWKTKNIQSMKVLEHKYLGATPTKTQYGSGWETRSEPIGPWSEDSFLVHLTGASNSNRLRILKNYFGKYL